MARFSSLFSSSSGNCSYIGSAEGGVLVDAGVSAKQINLKLDCIGVNPVDIGAIFVTHEHVDHIQGLGVFSRKYKVPIYATKGTLDGIRRCNSLGKLPDGILYEINTDEDFELGNVKIHPFNISHDANEPSGYRVSAGNKAVAVATDLGMYDDYIVTKLKNLNALVLEANHDIHMLEVGPYPYPLKQRVMGNKGHLSNELSGRLLCDILHDDLEYVILGHLSKENNFEELAYETVKLEITMGDNPYKGDDIPIIVAKRDSISEIITSRILSIV